MEATQLWVVSESTGSYDDYRTWPVAAFPTKEAAENWATKQDTLLSTNRAKWQQEGVEYNRRFNLLEETLVDNYEDYTNPAFKEAHKALDKEWEGKCQDADSLVNGYQVHYQSIPYHS